MGEREFPKTIESERLVLRRYEGRDAASLLELVARNRQELVREFAQVAALENIEQVVSFISEKSAQWEQLKNFCYGVWRKDAEQLLGQVQIKNIAWEIPAAELSYFIDKDSQRRGYASESVRAILSTAFDELGFERIFLRILPSNLESLALAKKLEFHEEGVHRNAFRCGFGQLHDVRYLALTSGDSGANKERTKQIPRPKRGS